MTSTQPSSAPAACIEGVVQGYRQCSKNTLQDSLDELAWAAPLVGFSRGDDALFEWYKEIVEPFHLTPLELFSETFPETPVSAEELSVILPQTEADNRQHTFCPAERWARSRIFGEQSNRKLGQHVVDILAERASRP